MSLKEETKRIEAEDKYNELLKNLRKKASDEAAAVFYRTLDEYINFFKKNGFEVKGGIKRGLLLGNIKSYEPIVAVYNNKELSYLDFSGSGWDNPRRLLRETPGGFTTTFEFDNYYESCYFSMKLFMANQSLNVLTIYADYLAHSRGGVCEYPDIHKLKSIANNIQWKYCYQEFSSFDLKLPRENVNSGIFDSMTVLLSRYYD